MRLCRNRTRRAALLSVLTFTVVFLSVTAVGLGQTKVTYWNMHGRAQFEEALVEQFNAEHPTIHVELIPVPGNLANSSHLIAAEVSGELPDVIYFDRALVTDLKLTGILKDLTPYIEATGWNLEKEWFPATLGTVTHRGRYYGLPRDGFPMSILAWNKKLFSESGLDPNAPPVSMDEMPTLHRRLLRTNPDGVAEQLAFVPWLGVGTYGLVQSLLWGSNWWDAEDHRVIVDGERNVEMMQWLGSWAQDLQPLMGRSWGVADLTNHKLAMSMVTSGNVIQYSDLGWSTDDIGFAPYPAAPGDAESRLYMAGEGFVIPERAKHPDEAWTFITWMMEAEQAATFAKESGVPPAKIENARHFMNEYDDPLYQQMIEAMLASETVAIPGTPLDINPAWLEMHKALLDVVNLRKDAQSALTEAQSVVQARLNEYLNTNGPWWE